MARLLLCLFFIYLVLEGALRKWLFPSLSLELFLLKDVILLGATVAHLCDQTLKRNAVEPLLTDNEVLLLLLWPTYFIGMFLITGFSLASLAGIRYYLATLPVAVLFPQAVPDTATFGRAATVYVLMALAVCLLGIVQFASPQDSLFNRYAWTTTHTFVAMFGDEHPRITGTFSYITPFASYLQFMFPAAWGLCLLASGKSGRILYAAGLALIFCAIVMTGSRATFVIALLSSLPFIFLLLRNSLRSPHQALFAIIGISVCALTISTLALPLTSLAQRNRDAGDMTGRIKGSLLMPIYTLGNIEFAGSGMGATFLGLQEAGGDEATWRFDEVRQDRIAVETGLFGYLLVLVIKFVFLGKSWELYRAASLPFVKVWALVSLVYQAGLLWQIPVYNSVATAFYFLSLGLFFWLRLEERRSWRVRPCP